MRTPAYLRTNPLLAVAGLVIAIALVVTVAGQVWLHHDHPQTDAGRDADVRDAAASGVAAVLSYDYRHLGADIASTEKLLTGRALADYRQVTRRLRRTAPPLKAVLDAEVKELAVVRSDDDTARVLLFVDQTSTSTRLTRPQTDQSRILATLRRSGGRWLLDSVKAI